jgi:hypothetical protein
MWYSLAEAMAAARGAVMRWLQAAQAQGLALPPASSADDLQARQAHGGRLVRTVEVMWPEPGDTP